jgi:predicted dehydrogenase
LVDDRQTMSARRAIGVGVVGLGFMGRTHIAAYRAAHAAGFANRLVAVCDSDPERRLGRAGGGGNLKTGTESELLFDPKHVRAHERAEQLFAEREVELVSICTHTTTHVELALAALAAGKHVLLEKPVALDSAGAQRLAVAAREAKTLCMPAICIRFWPAWAWVKRAIDERSFGAVRSAVFRRLGTAPQWAPGFYGDPAQSGGALLDLHVHDADFVRFCFGDPQSVSSTGSLDHVTTLYRFARGPQHVVAEGGWDHSSGFKFKMAFTVVFERATADYEFGREPELVLARDGKSEPVALDALNGYDGEVRHLLAAIVAGKRELAATMDDALAHTRLLEAERESLTRGAVVAL